MSTTFRNSSFVLSFCGLLLEKKLSNNGSKVGANMGSMLKCRCVRACMLARACVCASALKDPGENKRVGTQPDGARVPRCIAVTNEFNGAQWLLKSSNLFRWSRNSPSFTKPKIASPCPPGQPVVFTPSHVNSVHAVNPYF